MKGKNTLKRLLRGGLFALAAVAASVAIAFCGCKKDGDHSGDNSGDLPPHSDECGGEHDFGDWEIVSGATCTENGERSRSCKNCDEKQSEVIPATGHNYGVWIDERAATCTVDGVKGHYHCAACEKDFDSEKGELASLEILATGHNYLEVKKVAATCHDDGVKAHLRCENCGDRKLQGVSYSLDELKIPATHRTVKISEVAASCDKEGVAAHAYCYDCGKNFVDGVEKSAEELALPKTHTLKDIEESWAFCSIDGVKAHAHCLACGKNFINGVEQSAEDLIIPKGHRFGEPIKEANKREYYECKGCLGKFVKNSENGEYYQVDNLSPWTDDGKELVWHEEQAANCTKTGVKAHYTYEENGDKLYYDVNFQAITERELTIPAKGHNDIAVLQNDAYHTYKCKVCGEEKTTRINHSFSGGIRADVGGVIYRSCECECGYVQLEYDPEAIVDISAGAPFIVDRDDDTSFQIRFVKQNGQSGSIPKTSVACANWDEILAEVKAAGVYPVTRTLLMKHAECPKEVEVTFDILRYFVQPEYTVYQQGKLDSPGDVEIEVWQNAATYDAHAGFTRVKVYSGALGNSKITIIDDGGFDASADLTGGDKKYVVKFKVDGCEKEFEFSFWYTAARTAAKVYSDVRYLTILGEAPMIKVTYTDDLNDEIFESLELFELVEGTFDNNKLGWQKATFRLGNYAQAELSIYVADPDEILTVRAAESSFSVERYYVEKGADGISIDVTYFSGETGSVRLPASMFTPENPKDSFDINTEGVYQAAFEINGERYVIYAHVYDAENIRAENINVEGLQNLEWVYMLNENGVYELKYDLRHVTVFATLTNGEEETVPATADMISYNAADLNSAVANGDNELDVTLEYKGVQEVLRIFIAAEGRRVNRLGRLLLNGIDTYYIYVKDGKLFGDYELLVACDDENKTVGSYYVTLTEKMLYTATFDASGNMEDGTLAPFDMATAARGAYSLVLKFEDLSVGDGYLQILVLNDDDLEYQLYTNEGMAAFSAHFGTKEEVLAQFADMKFKYLVRCNVYFGEKSYYEEIEKEEISFSDLTVENADEIDFSKCGEIVLKLSYKGASGSFRAMVLPELELYARKAYTYVSQYSGKAVYTLYENGIYTEEDAYSKQYGEYFVVDEENGVYEINGDLFAVGDDGKSIHDFTGAEFGKKKNIQPEIYEWFGEKAYLYLKDGFGYLDTVDVDEDDGTEEINMTIAVRFENGVLVVDGDKYTVRTRTENGETVKYFEILVEGNTVYAYDDFDPNDYDEDSTDQSRCRVLFNDNGKAYYFRENREIPDGGTEFGEWKAQESYSCEWTKKDNLIVLKFYYSEVRFLIGADGALTALDDLY